MMHASTDPLRQTQGYGRSCELQSTTRSRSLCVKIGSMTDLLAAIVASRHLPPEPVATDALVHLCSGSPNAGSTFESLLRELCSGSSTDGLRFTGQQINPETEGRPDLVASDSQGTRLVVEAKFDAS